ncbi:hypothetical protein BSFA1_76780 (plasmid) [Burkholderia sp. SFA1]|nr:hypothetical protein BSFA1_76780 [Burkholderia sp. SFA1]
MPYIESLGEHWGTLCVTPSLASDWADRLLPLVTHVLEAEGFNYFVGVVPCLSALYASDVRATHFALLKRAEG